MAPLTTDQTNRWGVWNSAEVAQLMGKAPQADPRPAVLPMTVGHDAVQAWKALAMTQSRHGKHWP